MTPQEKELITGLFDRLASLENAPRDPDAERAIIEGLRRAPNAAYALVQTALVQDEALKRADARIRALEAQLGTDGAPQQGGFLDSMRDALLGRRDAPRGSVPSVRPQPQSQDVPPPSAAAWRQQSAFGAGGYGGGGGSFLGTAAAAAAGVIGGSLLLDGIRSMMGPSHTAFFSDPMAFGGVPASPWDSGAGGGSSDLAREAGIDNIGRGGEGAAGGGGGGFGLFDSGNDSDTDVAPDQDATDYADNSGDVDGGGDFGGGDFGGTDA